MKKIMTPRGHRSLQEELKNLKSQRPIIAAAIEEARSNGDLSENADYDAAKNKSGMIEAKIRNIESALAEAEIIDPKKITDTSSVKFGVTVVIQDIDTEEVKQFSIYGTEESDVSKGWISYESPLARSLIGKLLDDVVMVTLPGGRREYEIQEIKVDYLDE
jgi:transcription elongation factor GreA